jgi:hypothetical protein
LFNKDWKNLPETPMNSILRTLKPLFIFLLVGSTTMLPAQPGSGIRLGEQTLLVPSLSLSYNYNDNVAIRSLALSTEGGEILNTNNSDTYYSYLASLNLTRLANTRRLTLSGWYGQDAYQDYADLDGENYGGSGTLNWYPLNGSTKIDLSGRYEHAVDRAGSENLDLGTNPLRDVENISERVERDLTNARFQIDQQLVNRLNGAFIFGYDNVDYQEEVYFDRTSYDYIGELNFQASEKSQPYLRIGYVVDDDEGFEKDATKPYALAGLRHTATDKLRFDLGVGYETYTRTPLGSEELEDSALKYSLGANYQATAKSSFRLSARNGFDSVSNSASSSRRENAMVLTYRHQTTRRLNQSLVFSWREDDYLSPILLNGVEVDELKETLRYQYAMNYQTVRPWLSLFGKVDYEDGSSKIPGDNYNETEVSLGLKLQY